MVKAGGKQAVVDFPTHTSIHGVHTHCLPTLLLVFVLSDLKGIKERDGERWRKTGCGGLCHSHEHSWGSVLGSWPAQR